MRAAKANYIAILRIELDDLKTDIERLMEECSNVHEQCNISQNVFMQNLATFKNELLGVHAFQHILDTIAPDDYDTLDELIEDIRNHFQTLIQSHGLVKALQIYVNRKLDKVANYVKH